VSLCVERCGDLTVGPAGTTQLDDASDGSLFRLGRPDVALASLAGGCLAERVVAHCLATSGGLREAAILQALRDHFAVEFGEDAHDLTDGGSHWVIGVVSMDLARVGGEDPRSALSHERERRLLHGELAGDAVEAGHDSPSARPSESRRGRPRRSTPRAREMTSYAIKAHSGIESTRVEPELTRGGPDQMGRVHGLC
jgi:hypothetical protein